MCTLTRLFMLFALLRLEIAQKSPKPERNGSEKPEIDRNDNFEVPGFSCDFDVNYCGWRNDTSVEFAWRRNAGDTPSDDTGPPWDHTTHNKTVGSYIYIETSHPRREGDKARLISPVIQKPGRYCLRLWHHMHGANVRDLNVHTKGVESKKMSTVVHLSGAWSVVTSQHQRTFGMDGDWWNEQQTEFETTEAVQVILEATRGENYRGDIAVDDISLRAAPCPNRIIDCHFENNTCGWTQMSGDQFNWMPNTGETPTRATGPLYDHTTRTSSGRYMYAEASWPREEGDRARLLSPPINCTEKDSPMFTFWYYMHGENVGPLRVYFVEAGNVSAFHNWSWAISGEQGAMWKRAKVPVPKHYTSQRFRVIIESERKGYRGDVAIDDIVLRHCYDIERSQQIVPWTRPPEGEDSTTIHDIMPPPPATQSVELSAEDAKLPAGLNCDFDNGLCGWTSGVRGDFNWTVNRGKTPSLKTGPQHDHTTGDGRYLFIEASSPRVEKQSAILRSPLIPSTLRVCLQFYYHMYGESMGQLEVLTSQARSGRFYQKWSVSGEQSKHDKDWRYAEVDIREHFDYEIIFRGVVGSQFYSDMAIDDISVKPSACRRLQTTGASSVLPPTSPAGTNAAEFVKVVDKLTCDFDLLSFCYWSQLQSDQFDWAVSNRAQTLSPNTGPSTDHTGGGQFAYIEASNRRSKHDKAKLQSPSFNLSEPACFSMWYHMFGNGSLAVYAVTSTNDTSGANTQYGKTTTLLWRRSGNNGNSWIQMHANLMYGVNMNLVIEASTGKNFRGDISIDDLRIEAGECPLLNCTFDTGLCGWMQDTQRDDFNWTRTNNGTATPNTGPERDHTHGVPNGKGYYLYINAKNPREKGDRSRLISPIVLPEDEPKKCLTFWYHSFGSNIGELNVYKKSPDHSSDDYLQTPEWSINTDEGDQWLFASVDIDDNHPYQIVIEGVRGDDSMGDIAIDDIGLADGQCHSCCGDEYFRCGNGFCISNALRCDNKDDCGDWSDESGCQGCGWAPVPPRTSHLFGTQTSLGSIGLFESAPDQRNATVSRTNLFDDIGPIQVARIPHFQLKRIRVPNLRLSKLAQPSTGIRKEQTKPIPLRGLRPKTEVVWSRRKREAAQTARRPRFSFPSFIFSSFRPRPRPSAPKPKKKVRKVQIYGSYAARKSSRRAEPLPLWQWNMMRNSLNRESFGNRRGLLHRAKRYALKKITGGSQAVAQSWPWQAAYYIYDPTTESHHFCGGTLIDVYWMVTAAHCPTLGDDQSVVVGDHDLYEDSGTEQELKVDVVYINRVFQFSEDLVGDIALVKFRYPARTSRAVQPACLLGNDDERFPSGYNCAITGWGRIDSDAPGVERYLRQGEAPIIGHEVCQTKFLSDYNLHDSMICAGATGSNTCRGDSGGPLVCRRDDKYYLVGITSWGDTRCKGDIPGVYTRVQSYMDWIKRIIDSEKCQP